MQSTIDTVPSGGSIAQVTVGTPSSGSIAAIEVGQTVLIGTTSDTREAYFRGFARKTPSGSVIYLNETSDNIQVGDTLTVIDDFAIWEKLARLSGGTAYKNYDETFRELDPIITNLKSAYVGIGSGTPEQFTQRFQPTAIAGTSGGSISSYAFTISSGMTVTAGDANTNDVTIAFDPGHYWLKLVVTDSGGRTSTRRIPVWSVPSDLSSQVALGFDGADLDADLDGGWHGSVTAFDGISSILDNTLVVVWDVEHYNGTETTIDGNNVKFVGRLRTETDPLKPDDDHGFIKETSFELEGIGDQLSRIPTLPLTLVNDSTPTIWDEINNLTYWRSVAHLLQTHSTALTLCALSFSDTSNNSVFDTWGIDGGDLLSELQGIAEDWVANVEFAPDGRIEVNQRATQLSTTARDALTTVAALTNQDFIELEIAHAHLKEIGQVEAGGGVYNTTSDTIQEYLSRAPGDARDPYVGVFQMPGQVLTANTGKAAAETEMNTRAGHALAEQNPADELTVTMPDGWNFLIPTRRAWFTWTLTAADTNIRDIAYTTSERWLLTSISISHDNETGAKDVSATFRRETTGAAGVTVEIPPESSIDFILPNIPPFSPYPGFPIDIGLLTPPGVDFEPPPFWGDIGGPGETPGTIEGVRQKAVFFGTGTGATNTGAWTSQEFIDKTSPVCIDVTPATLPSGYYVIHGKLGFGTEAYLLTTDGSDSILWYTSNVWSNSPTWVQNTTLTGVYRLIRLGSTQGVVVLYGSAAASGLGGESFTSAPAATTNISPPGFGQTLTGSIVADNRVGLTWDVDAKTIFDSFLQMQWTADWDHNGNQHTQFKVRATPRPDYASSNYSSSCTPYDRQPDLSILVGNGPSVTPTTQASASKTVVGDTIEYVFNLSANKYVFGFIQTMRGWGSTGGTCAAFTDVFDIEVYEIDSSSVSAGGARTVYSTDYGATFAGAVTIGDPVTGSYAGMDTIKIGDEVLSASAGEVDLAQAGGAYSAYGSAMPTGAEAAAILIPRVVFGSLTGNNADTTTPEYLVASDLLTASNEALWKVTSSGTVQTDITYNDGSNYGIATGPDCLAMSWRSGKKIAVVMLFGSLPRLITSDDAGATWTDHGVLTANANAVTFRKGDEDIIELYGTDGQPWFTLDAFSGVATITKRSYPGDPTTEPVKWIDVYG